MKQKYKHLIGAALAAAWTGVFVYGVIFLEQKVLFAVAAVICGFMAVRNILRFVNE